ncbi:MAG: T9SS type A sorting domain-containing protein [Chitinophagaceae bacterium]|nr:T9SS type A sorting domain-containing protein [Chitinophagaceae bacterium]
MQKQQKDKVIVSPNPANSIVNVEFSTNVQSNSTKLTVTDQMGNIVLQKIISTVKGVNKKTLDISMLKNGIYSVNITKANTVISSKVIVNK